MAAHNEEDDLPSELQDRLSSFDDALSCVEDTFNSLHSIPYNELQSQMAALDRAKVDLLGAYAINSLFWTYLSTRGENPQEHGVKQELDRIRSCMGRVKEIQDKEKQPKLNQDASQRFVRSALWQIAHGKKALLPTAAKPDTSKGSSSPLQSEAIIAKRPKRDSVAMGDESQEEPERHQRQDSGKHSRGRGSGKRGGRGGGRGGGGRGGGGRYHQVKSKS